MFCSTRYHNKTQVRWPKPHISGFCICHFTCVQCKTAMLTSFNLSRRRMEFVIKLESLLTFWDLRGGYFLIAFHNLVANISLRTNFVSYWGNSIDKINTEPPGWLLQVDLNPPVWLPWVVQIHGSSMVLNPPPFPRIWAMSTLHYELDVSLNKFWNSIG